MQGHTKSVIGAVYLPDGRRIITCSYDGSLRLWNLESGEQIGDDWRDDDDCSDADVWSIALSPNGKTLASGSLDGKVKLWDVEVKKVVAKWTGHTMSTGSLRWSVGGERLVIGSSDGTIRVWDVESGEIVLGPIKTGHEYVSAVIYSPDTTKIATGGYGKTGIKIWAAKTGNLLSTIKLDFTVFSLAWTSDQKKLLAASYPSIRIFNTATWRQIAILEGHTNSVYCLSLFQNDRLLASGSFDNTARLWNLDTNLPVGPPIHHEGSVGGAAISANGKLLVTGCGDNNAYVWDIHTTLKDAGLQDLLSKVTARKSLMHVRDPFANLGHECNHQHFRLMLRDVYPSARMPIDYRHVFLMTFEMVFRCVVNIQFMASLANIRALSLPALIRILLHIASLIPRHHLHMPSSIDFPPSSTALKILINQWNSNRAVLIMSKSLQFGTNRYIWVFLFIVKV